jgi:hypothetical protein
VAQFEAGKTALNNARVAEAELYAPQLYKQAADSLNAATAEMQKEDDRFALLRDYDRTVQLFTAAQTLADQAVVAAGAEKERVRVADSALVVEIESLITATKANLAKAPRGKGSRVDLKVMSADIDAAATALAAAQVDYQAGNYLTAQGKLEAVKPQVKRVPTDIDAAVAKMPGGK